MCRLCLKESFFILFHPETASLNKKNEIYQSCKHRHFKFLADCKITWTHKFNPKALSLLMRKLCSITNHNLVSVLADESLTKQICTNISNTVMRQLLLSLWSWETKWSWRDQYISLLSFDWWLTHGSPILFVKPNNNTVDQNFKPSDISRAMIRIIWPRGQITVWPHWHIGTEAAALMWGERERVITKGRRREFIGIGARKRNGL